MYFSVVRGGCLSVRSIVDHIEDERGVVKKIVLDERFIDGL